MNAPLTKPAKKRWALLEAAFAAKELIAGLLPFCERVEVAGSVRRQKEAAGDIEILFIPKFREDPNLKADLFEPAIVNVTERALTAMMRAGVLSMRINAKNQFSWGPKNKLGIHVPTGIPVDLFTATEENWWNYLVCRTGPSASNIRICEAALARGWKWKPYGSGFCHLEDGEETQDMHAVSSEREVFEFVGLPYQEPWERI